MDALEILNDLIGAAQVSYRGTAEYKRLKDWDQAITVEIKKSVSWDQQELAAIAQRIASNGDDPAEYIDVKYSVSERKFAAWPETLRRPFEAARTLKPAKPAFRLAINGEGK